MAGIHPTVSIVLPVYNQAHYLPAALDGVFAQTYPHFELIVVDDGSTDDTPRKLADYRQRHTLTVVTQANQGLPGALNAGLARARGDYITWTSSDNVMNPDMLAVLAAALDEDPSVGLVYAGFALMDDAGRDLGYFSATDYDPLLLLHVNLVHCCFLYRRECMERIGGYDLGFIYGEDWEYWIRLSRYFRMKRVPGVLYRYRFHAGSMTSELVLGTARRLGHDEFSARIRRRMPVRWWLGRLKWWWLRLAVKDHPALAERDTWRRLSTLAACPPNAPAGRAHGALTGTAGGA